ncbi:hypothetical protein FRC12_004789 [Ceratobasidium sp. 428]|nr:hypothetical protein FRC12_004789 [Ceratobasidium sp. 428]
MASNSSRDYELPASIYVDLAKTCKPLQVETTKGSGTYVRAKCCCFCNRSVRLGAGSSDHSLQQHMRSAECQKYQKSPPDSKHSPETPSTKLATGFPTSSVVLQPNPPLVQPPSTSQPALDTAYMGLDPALRDAAPACPGAFVNFGASMFSHYPWHLHDTAFLEYDLSYIDPGGQFFFVRSRKCCRKPSASGLGCESCDQVVLGRQLQDLLQRARPGSKVPPSLNTHFRTYAQVCDVVSEKTAQINALHLKQLTEERRVKSLSGRLLGGPGSRTPDVTLVFSDFWVLGPST